MRNFIFNNKNIICIVGLGYVGLPLLIEFSKFYKTIGLDTDELKLKKIKKNYNFIFKNNIITTDNKKINLADIIIVCLPTPINKSKKPDISILKNASKVIGKNIKKNTIVIYESTVYPGTTEKICLPILEKNSGLKEGLDFHIAYSPERINPGDKKNTLTNVAKVVSAKNYQIARITAKLYQKIIKPKIFIAPSILVAETAKIIENVQRDINIALINELSLICNKLNINTKDVLEASETKWNFLKFRPGLVGGHCIGVDPYYLSYLSKKIGHNPILIDSGRKINDEMTMHVYRNIRKILPKSNSRILIMGVAFKKNCDDIRNSKIIELAEILSKNNYKIILHDPLVNFLENLELLKYRKIDTFSKKRIPKFDAIVLGAGHDLFNKYNDNFYKKNLVKNGTIFDLDYFFKKNKKKYLKFNFWNL
jgi:UDP-N-acetyl-D-galactosamine dehydrogenase